MNHIAVLLGGFSSEREISLISGQAIAHSLEKQGYRVSPIDVTKTLWEQLQQAQPDIIINALHGDWGEDGRVQGVLELYGKPYSHSGVMASALAMDKHRAKAVLRDAGITVPRGVLVNRQEAAKHHPLEPPYVLKPNGQGSSVGVYIIKAGDKPAQHIADNHAMGEEIIAEHFIAGRELTVAVMDNQALAVTEIIPKTPWYNYEAKYAAGGSRHIVPAQISPEATQLCLDWALLAHKILGCRGISRSDFRFDEKNPKKVDMVNKMVMLELNTQPGMTPTSLVPEQAAYVGMDFDQLCRWMVEDASWPR